jgi:DNA-binding transcriptional MerR regulator
LISVEKALPAIPPKRYFTIGEVSELCGVKPYVLRYWEQEFTQLRPMKRRGNRRYYQHHEVLLIRRIRELLYDQGFTISGARNRLSEAASRATGAAGHPGRSATDGLPVGSAAGDGFDPDGEGASADALPPAGGGADAPAELDASIAPTASDARRAGLDGVAQAGLATPSAVPPARHRERVDLAASRGVAVLRAELLAIRELLTP